MFPRLAEHYRSVVEDLVMSLQALASSLQSAGFTATCYSCGDGRDGHGASFVADIGDGHMVRFLVSDFGISWVESRNGRELVKLEGAEAIQELQRMADLAQEDQVRAMQSLAQAACNQAAASAAVAGADLSAAAVLAAAARGRIEFAFTSEPSVSF